jgi:hypothetical protein
LVVVARGWQIIWIGAVLALGGGAAQAENLDAGKSAPALFAATCMTCHASPKGLAKDTSGLPSFLSEHYTSSRESAAALATYLIANAGSPRGKPAPANSRAATGPSEGTPAHKRGAGRPTESPAARTEQPAPQTATVRPDSMIEPVEPRRPHGESAKGRGKRQQTKQETPPAPPPGAEAPAAQPAASAPAAAAAPVAASPPPPDQSAFSAPSP